MNTKHFNGFARYNRTYNRSERGYDNSLPAEPGKAHAIPVRQPNPPKPPIHAHGLRDRERDFLAENREPIYGEGSTSWKALCGKMVRVVTPSTFQGDDPDACQTCATEEYNLEQT